MAIIAIVATQFPVFIREKPINNARQTHNVHHGMALEVLRQYPDQSGQFTWYEVKSLMGSGWLESYHFFSPANAESLGWLGSIKYSKNIPFFQALPLTPSYINFALWKQNLPQNNKDALAACDLLAKVGNLIFACAKVLDISPLVALSTLLVESGGRPYYNFDGRDYPTIRIELHVLRDQHRKNNSPYTNIIETNFTGRDDSRSYFDSQQNRWIKFGGISGSEGQRLNWLAFNEAARYGYNEASAAISLGLPQVMGFNYATLGYSNAAEQFRFFTHDIRWQLLGYFDFIVNYRRDLLNAVRARDFGAFAGIYNGRGGLQPGSYGEKMLKTYQNLSQVMAVLE